MLQSDVQNIARNTLSYIKSIIQPRMPLLEVRQLCEAKMLSLGADSFWYWNVGAFIFSGKETTLSVSGRDYLTSNRVIEENDIVTLDLSPQKDKIWGDFARTIVIEKGKVIETVEDIENEEWRNGLKMEEQLHHEMLNYVTTMTTFEELFFYINEYINRCGYINLDFMGNLGHSIEREKDKRIYIEKGNALKLSDVSFFTFEPHIANKHSSYGYKKENIYYFNNGVLSEL